MPFEQRDGSGALFRNKQKVVGDNKPDYTGNAMVNGQMVDIAAWVKPMKKTPSKNYMSLSFKPPRAPEAGGMGEYQGETDYVPPQPLRPIPPTRRPPPAMPPEPDTSDLPF